MEEKFCVQNPITIKKFPTGHHLQTIGRELKNSYESFIIDKIEDLTIDQT